jgi:hypothetical protein
MSKDIAVFCNSCNACQVLKVSNQRPHSLLHTLLTPTRPWELVGIDFMGPLLKLLDFDYLIVVIDYLTLSVHLIWMNTNVMAMQVALLYLSEVVRLHSIPASIISDRDSKFTSIFWHETLVVAQHQAVSVHSFPSTDGWSNQVSQLIDWPDIENIG